MLIHRVLLAGAMALAACGRTGLDLDTSSPVAPDGAPLADTAIDAGDAFTADVPSPVDVACTWRPGTESVFTPDGQTAFLGNVVGTPQGFLVAENTADETQIQWAFRVQQTDALGVALSMPEPLVGALHEANSPISVAAGFGSQGVMIEESDEAQFAFVPITADGTNALELHSTPAPIATDPVDFRATPSGYDMLIAFENDRPGTVRVCLPVDATGALTSVGPPMPGDWNDAEALAFHKYDRLVASDGSVLLAWVTLDASTSAPSLEAAQFTADGVLLETEHSIASAARLIEFVSLMQTPTGNFATWLQDDGTADQDVRVHVQQVDAHAGPVGANNVLAASSICGICGLVATFAGGSPLVAWVGGNSQGGTDLTLQPLTPDGVAATDTPIVLTHFGAGDVHAMLPTATGATLFFEAGSYDSPRGHAIPVASRAPKRRGTALLLRLRHDEALRAHCRFRALRLRHQRLSATRVTGSCARTRGIQPTSGAQSRDDRGVRARARRLGTDRHGIPSLSCTMTSGDRTCARGMRS